MKQLIDEELIAQLKNGNQECLGILYERYKSLLLDYFLRVTNDANVSNDLLMETFLRLHKYKGSFKPNGKFRNWLYSIANNLVRDHFKAEKKRSLNTLEKTLEKTTHNEMVDDRVMEHQMLHSALEKLPRQDRILVNQRFLLEMSF